MIMDNRRVRNKIINFHVTEQELEQIETSAKLAQMSKTDFFHACLFEKEIVLDNDIYFSDRLCFELRRLMERLDNESDSNKVEIEILRILQFLVNGKRHIVENED